MLHLPVELLAVAGITLLAVVSPGPDFAFIVRCVVTRGSRAGYLGAAGIATGIAIHVSYTLLGFGLVLARHAWLIDIVRYLGAAYLIWLGLGAWWPRDRGDANVQTRDAQRASGQVAAWRQGLLCNLLNPKAMLFIVALFSQVVATDTTWGVRCGYGVFIVLAHLVWFALVARLLALPAFSRAIARGAGIIDRVVGGLLVALGVRMASLP
ncbi:MULTISPECIES: LysE family transporter [unclassified Modicisalibacter]|uniref:LysE family transporter n=1 Tax=unclassified Modicisalibacter TaxID=2679913 RepID=UPI001CCE3D8C|nr:MULTISPECIES: LysE family transporter [unclassified Modicisalibacter]MBZ9559890.1 LysE family transporter [Modicisalibacter sp. R2A 31.J]MBZ9577342.1 LysE family transporter [Modicisalibacter sp. MOD 31.J]